MNKRFMLMIVLLIACTGLVLAGCSSKSDSKGTGCTGCDQAMKSNGACEPCGVYFNDGVATKCKGCWMAKNNGAKACDACMKKGSGATGAATDMNSQCTAAKSSCCADKTVAKESGCCGDKSVATKECSAGNAAVADAGAKQCPVKLACEKCEGCAAAYASNGKCEKCNVYFVDGKMTKCEGCFKAKGACEKCKG